MKFYYTTSAGTDVIQSKQVLSLGGFKSSSSILNDEFDNLFGELTAMTISNDKDEYMALMLVNETGVDLVNVQIWLNHPETSYSLIEVAGVIPTINADGEYYFERIPTKNSRPFYAEFETADVDNKYFIGELDANGHLGVWFKRSLLQDFIETNSLDIYQEDPLNPRQYVPKDPGTEDSIDIKLSWEQNTETYNYPDLITGDSFLGVQFVLPVGAAYDLTGATAVIEIATTVGGVPVLTFETPTTLLMDTINRSLTVPEQIISLPAALYYHRLRINFLDGRVRTYVQGTWLIKP